MLNSIKNHSRLLYRNCKFLLRKHSNVVLNEFTVPTFCDIHINVPWNVNIKPLNVHKYHNCDKLIIEVLGGDQQSLQHTVDGNRVEIFGKPNENYGISCNIKAPVKANLFIKSTKDITAGQFQGDKIALSTTQGNLTVDKFQGDTISLITTNGDIRFKNSVQATKISASVLEVGSIIAEKLQGIQVHLKTFHGNISVGSSYCQESRFEVSEGNMDLRNVHQSCKICLGKGSLNLVGLDGSLDALISSGNADVHLARITGKSRITMEEAGMLNLRLSDCCQANPFNITAKTCDVDGDVKLALSAEVDHDQPSISINCINSCIHVSQASWQDMIALKFK